MSFIDASKDLRERFYSLVEALSALRDLADVDVLHCDDEQLAARAVTILSEHLALDYCALLLRRGARLERVAAQQWPMSETVVGAAAARAPLPSAFAEDLASEAALGGHLVHCPDLARAAAGSDDATAGPGSVATQGSVLCAPVLSQGEVLGVVQVYHPKPGYFELWHEHTITLFCAVLGHVVNSSRLLRGMVRTIEERTAELTQTGARLEREIAGREEAEEALSESRQLLNTIIDIIPAMVNAKDTASRYLFMNRYQAELYGVDPQAAVGKRAGELLGEGYGARTEALDREVLASGRPLPYYEEDFVDARGVRHTFLTTKVPLGQGGAGRPSTVATISVDITDRKRAEQALEESQRALETLMSNLPGMAYRARGARDGSFEFVSEGCVELTGYEPADLVAGGSVTYHSLIHPDDRETTRGRIQAGLRERRPFQVVYRLFDACHHQKWVREQGRGIYTEEGALLAAEGFVADITEAHTLSEQLAYQASHDALTGLVNRREFEHRLRHALESAQASDAVHALCYLDLDQFKVINDTCGHIAGDELLRQIGALLQAKVRKTDTLARLGGDEFGVLMEQCSLKQAERVARELRRVVEDYQFIWEDKSFKVGVSIGLVPITAASESITEVMSAADTACYAAKDQGRNRIHVYRADDSELARRHGEMQWVARINRALEEGRFQLTFQPIVPVVARHAEREPVKHFEFLIRMRDEDGEVIPPGVFLPAAERYNVSTKLDRWVIETAFAWLTASPQHLKRVELCSINLSAHSLGDDEFLAFVTEKFHETRIPPHQVCFEITETAAIANLTSASRFIKALKELGCRFALDDFGSGLSSFAYLKTLPVDFLKIDGMFVKDIVEDPIDQAMVRSINEIGQVMGKQTIAEFVESEAILDKLREIGVDYAQGYGIGRPQPIENIPYLRVAV